MPSDKYINEDTYQTLEDVKIKPQSDFEKSNNTTMEKDTDKIIQKSPHEIFVGTPVHSDVTIHYTQALIEFQGECFKEKIKVSFHMMKSSLVTQGRNLCVQVF